jgi:hypothetical protein
MRSKDWCCRARGTPARLLWRARIAYAPHLRERQSFVMHAVVTVGKNNLLDSTPNLNRNRI